MRTTLFILAILLPTTKLGVVLASSRLTYSYYSSTPGTIHASSRQQHQLRHHTSSSSSSFLPSRHYDAAAASILSVSRGGAVDVDDLYDEEYDEEYDSDADFDLDFEDMDMEANEGDFAENNTLERAWESWKKTPPFTQMYISLSIGATMLGFLTNNNEFPKILSLEWKPTLTKLQLWRPFTSFLNIGAFNLGYLMTAHFVWTYMSTLERLNHDKPYDFWLMIVFGCVSMVTGYSLLGLSPRFLGHNLSTFFVYVWSRYHEGLEVNMMELFNTRAEMLPWFFLAQTALLEGELPLLDMLGIVFGHIYHYCKTTNAIRTPKAVINWYMSDSKYSNMIREKYKVISSDFEMQ